MSAKLDFYDIIKARLLEKVPAIKTLRLFNSQFDKEEVEDAFEYPAVFVQFLNLNWIAKPQGLQEADAVIRLHVGFHSLKTEEREIFKLIEDIHKALQNLSTAQLFGDMNRVNEEQDIDHGNVIVWLADYSTLLTDISGYRSKDLVLTQIADADFTRESEGVRLNQIHE
jgi:hypothetical protein